MRCAYKDDFKIDYTGTIHVAKGDGVDLVVKASEIPANVKLHLDSAVARNSCDDLRSAVTALIYGISRSFNAG